MRKTHTIHNHRGFTLIELTIVLAITAIISTMVVSFSMLISAQTKKNNIRTDFLQATAELRSDLQKEFSNHIDGAGEISVAVVEKSIKFEFTSTTASWQYEYKCRDEDIEKIEVTFPAEPVQGSLLKVTVTGALSEPQSFLIYSHCNAEFTHTPPPSLS